MKREMGMPEFTKGRVLPERISAQLRRSILSLL